MYNLPSYRETDPHIIKEFIDKHPFAFLSGCDAENKPVATQVPVFIEEKDGKQLLRGHIMRKTAHHKAFLQNENVLVVFTSQHHTYVSATWYSNPHQASTWNFMSVQAKGILRFLDEAVLEDVLQMTSLHFENYNHESTTVYNNLAPEYKQRLIHAIVAFEIEIQEMDAIFKLSQDRDAQSYRNIIAKLREQDEAGRVIAEEMEGRYERVFPA